MWAVIVLLSSKLYLNHFGVEFRGQGTGKESVYLCEHLAHTHGSNTSFPLKMTKDSGNKSYHST